MQSEFIDLTTHHMNDDHATPNLAHDLGIYLEHKETVTKLGYDPLITPIIHFYEWSDINQERMFNDTTIFFNFLKECDIEIRSWEESQIQRMSRNNGVFIMCKPKTHALLVEASKKALEDSLKRATTVYTYPSYNPNYSRYYDCEDWD